MFDDTKVFPRTLTYTAAAAPSSNITQGFNNNGEHVIIVVAQQLHCVIVGGAVLTSLYIHFDIAALLRSKKGKLC